MSEVFVIRTLEPALNVPDVMEMGRQAMGCFDIYRIQWNGSLLSADGSALFCHFTAPDTESVRTALRQLGSSISSAWECTVHEAPGISAGERGTANVLVERNWDSPVELDDIQAIEDAGAWCLEAYDVRFMRTFFSTDRRHMACLYQGPDAESVRQAQRQAGMPVDRVVAVQPITG
jgi:hypothetical protein